MRVIKKYTNRRLYDTQTSSYINLTQLIQLITEGETLKVIDAKSADDLSQEILLQAFLECPGVQQLFAPAFLHRMIRALTTDPSQQRINQLSHQLQAIDPEVAFKIVPASPPPIPEAEQESTSSTPEESNEMQSQVITTKPLPERSSSSQPVDEPPKTVPEVMEDPKLDSLRNRLAALESRLRGS